MSVIFVLSISIVAAKLVKKRFSANSRLPVFCQILMNYPVFLMNSVRVKINHGESLALSLF